MGTAGQTELGWEDMAGGAAGGKFPVAAGIGKRMKDGKGPSCRTMPGSVWNRDPAAPPLLAWDPPLSTAFPCCFTSLPLPHPSPVFSPGALKSGRVGNQRENAGEGMLVALQSPRFFWVKNIHSMGLEQAQEEPNLVSSCCPTLV